MQKEKIHAITGVIHCVSGLRVGGSDGLLEIGATELTCIKNPTNSQPYIPGSSIKGKLRSEMECKKGINGPEPCGCGKESCLICRVFGPHKNTHYAFGPPRLIVRDAQPSAAIICEIKTENIINRKTGAAEHPRSMERVPAGTKFDFKLSIQEWDIDKTCSYPPTGGGETGGKALIEFIKDAMRLVQATGIGSGITRGSGEIKFESLKLNGADFTL